MHKKINIQAYNLINGINSVEPNYNLSDKETYFELYFSPNEKIAIVGKVDNNYSIWCSLTNLEEVDKNELIFNFIANNSFNTYSIEYKAFGTKLYSDILSTWHKCNITRSDLKNMTWNTPFGHYYGKGLENHGLSFARELKKYFNEQQKLCESRTLNGNYLSILEDYSKILDIRDDYGYYYKVKPLISILENEAYLRLSPNINIRNKYNECMEKASILYNFYMSNVR